MKNIRINIKPLSVNKAYSGHHFPTKELTAFKKELSYLLPREIKLPLEEEKLEAEYEFGVSSRGADLDNHIKCFQDVISERYGFNDNRIYKLLVHKIVVEKGNEYIRFLIKKHEP